MSHLKETAEDMRIWVGQEDKGQESGEASIEDSRANVSHGILGPLVSCARLYHERMGHMSSVVNT